MPVNDSSVVSFVPCLLRIRYCLSVMLYGSHENEFQLLWRDHRPQILKCVSEIKCQNVKSRKLNDNCFIFAPNASCQQSPSRKEKLQWNTKRPEVFESWKSSPLFLDQEENDKWTYGVRKQGLPRRSRQQTTTPPGRRTRDSKAFLLQGQTNVKCEMWNVRESKRCRLFRLFLISKTLFHITKLFIFLMTLYPKGNITSSSGNEDSWCSSGVIDAQNKKMGKGK